MKKPKIVMLVAMMVAISAGPAFAADGLYRLAFCTMPVYQAVETDIATYNGWMQDEADDAGIGMGGIYGDLEWKVIGSTVDIDARDNTETNPLNALHADVPIYLTDGTTLLATGNADLWDGALLAPLNLGPTAEATPHQWAFTGTYLDGTKHTAGLYPNAGNPLGTTGEVSQGNGGVTTDWVWRTWTSDPGETMLPLYAISDVIPEPATMCLLGLGGLAMLRRRR